MPRGRRVRMRVARWVVPAACGLAAPAWAEGGEDIGRYGDLGQAFTLLIIFAGLLYLLGRFAWKPILQQLKRREEEIAERLRDSERRRQKARELEAEHKARLEAADAEAQQVLARGLREAAKAREEMLAAARQETTRSVEEAKKEIENFKQAALHDLQDAMAGMAVDVAAEILRERLDAEKQQQLLEESLERIRRRAGRGV